MSYSDILAEDKCLIVVRPSLVKIAGSFLGAAILGQVIYWWKKSGNQPFYKFKEPCKHEKYIEGDSWAEELAVSTEQFDTAMKRLLATGLVSAQVNASRLTFYTLNEVELEVKAKAFYVKRDSRFTKNELPGLSAPALEDISKTETTSEISPIVPKGDKMTEGIDVCRKPAVLCSEAELIYRAYPNHDKPLAALRAIKKALKIKPFDHLIKMTIAYAKATSQWMEKDKQYIPQPASWFNAGGYDSNPKSWQRYNPDRLPDQDQY